MPMRGVNWVPQLGPARASLMRTQVPLVSLPGALPAVLAELGASVLLLVVLVVVVLSLLPVSVKPPALGWFPRCQANWTLTRWLRSVVRVSPERPTTWAVCGPGAVWGAFWAQARGTTGTAARTAQKWLR